MNICVLEALKIMLGILDIIFLCRFKKKKKKKIWSHNWLFTYKSVTCCPVSIIFVLSCMHPSSLFILKKKSHTTLCLVLSSFKFWKQVWSTAILFIFKMKLIYCSQCIKCTFVYHICTLNKSVVTRNNAPTYLYKHL